MEKINIYVTEIERQIIEDKGVIKYLEKEKETFEKYLELQKEAQLKHGETSFIGKMYKDLKTQSELQINSINTKIDIINQSLKVNYLILQKERIEQEFEQLKQNPDYGSRSCDL